MTENCKLEGSRSQVELPRKQAGEIGVGMKAGLILPSTSRPPGKVVLRQGIHPPDGTIDAGAGRDHLV